jgi:hypothetical protein
LLGTARSIGTATAHPVTQQRERVLRVRRSAKEDENAEAESYSIVKQHFGFPEIFRINALARWLRPYVKTNLAEIICLWSEPSKFTAIGESYTPATSVPQSDIGDRSTAPSHEKAADHRPAAQTTKYELL